MSRRLLRVSLFLLFYLAVSPSAAAQCLPDQSAALLKLKQNFRPSSSVFVASSLLPSWQTGTDCCRGWVGVTCESASGEVVALDLGGLSISGDVDPALFRLTSLRSLNLSCNNLSSASIPSSGFERLTSLTHLNLSDSGFSGKVPAGISRLRSLLSLDLSAPGLCSESSLTLHDDPDLPTLIRNLSNLQYLHLDGVNVSAGGRVWGPALSSSVPKLRELSMYRCFLSGPIDESFSELKSLVVLRLNENNLNAKVPEFFGDFSSLRILRLSSCGLRGSLPGRIFRLPALETLDVSTNPSLSGSLPDFPPDMALQDLVLLGTNFSGGLPESIGNLRLLKTLFLSGCKFSGALPSSLQNLTQLVAVDLSLNNFSGPIPSMAAFPNISKLDLQNNSLSGAFPSWVFRLISLRSLQLNSNRLSGILEEIDPIADSSLETVNLSSNRLQGPLPKSIEKLQRLKVLQLADNELNGTVEISLFGSLKNLSILDLSYNRLTVLSAAPGAEALPNVSTLNLAFCGLETFPPLPRNLPRLTRLDLSGNKINGAIPGWLWSAASLAHLNLSFNSLTGFESPPDFSRSSLKVLDLHSNNLQGPIPLPPPSNFVVDFSNNSFTSSIPPKIGASLNFTVFFSVSRNRLTGAIPESFCGGTYLQVLDLSHNSLAGEIPGCLVAGGNDLQVLNLRSNKLTGALPGTFQSECKLRSLNLNGNEIRGAVPQSLKNCKILEVLDLGNNEIEDGFPFWLGNLSELRVLVLRSNKLHGPLTRPPGSDSTFSMLRIMDLSSNRFNGSLESEWFRSWKAMITPDEFSGGKRIVAFGILSELYYRDSVNVTSKGLELTLVKILTIFASLDLSDNDFQGIIPPAVAELKALHVLNMSQNNLTGPIPPAIGDLQMLESLDLSRNQLSGEIPPGLSSIPFLSFLNLSYNRLVGRIPRGTQLQTFGSDSYLGNEGLCGEPLSAPCSVTSEARTEATARYSWELIFIGLGYGGGMALVFGPFVLWGDGRRWFNRRVDRKLQVVVPVTFLLLCSICPNSKIDKADSFVEDERFEEEDDGRERRFCIFCTQLEFRGQKVGVRHGPCSCAAWKER